MIRQALIVVWVAGVLLGSQRPHSDNASRVFDEQALAEYSEDADFQYGAKAQEGTSWISRFLFWLTERFVSLMSTPGGQVLGKGFWYLLLATIAIGAVILILRMRYGHVLIRDYANRQITPVSIQQEENADYQQLLTEAQSSGELKLAARYLFLWTIQKMNDRGVIEWKKWKTSHDYATEIINEKRHDYLSLSRFFESSWFGGHEPTSEELSGFLEISESLVHA
ncbi:MAG: DUF4129 domain-containing protein [Bacteroidota bacterium]